MPSWPIDKKVQKSVSAVKNIKELCPYNGKMEEITVEI